MNMNMNNCIRMPNCNQMNRYETKYQLFKFNFEHFSAISCNIDVLYYKYKYNTLIL